MNNIPNFELIEQSAGLVWGLIIFTILIMIAITTLIVYVWKEASDEQNSPKDKLIGRLIMTILVICNVTGMACLFSNTHPIETKYYVSINNNKYKIDKTKYEKLKKAKTAIRWKTETNEHWSITEICW